jgi:hypothetical protein
MIKYVRAYSCIRIKVIILEETASKNKIPEQYITHISSSRVKTLFVIESAKIIITEENVIEVVISNNKDVRPIESLSKESCL